jgi:hypothetical protein
MEKLKPCPFCGEIPQKVYQFGTETAYNSRGWGKSKPLFEVDHHCNSSHGYSAVGAIKAWNTRVNENDK